MDIVLTDYGRELLSKNNLNFSYYAFSDEGIDYSGSLALTSSTNMTFDNYMHKELLFEADQRKNSDLKSFLYTIPHDKKVLPQFKVNVDLTSSMTLERKYYIDSINLENTSNVTIKKPIDVVARAVVDKKTLDFRTQDYVNTQRLGTLFELFKELKENGK